MNDLISRQAAIDAMCSVCGYNCNKSDFVYNAPQDEQVILCPEHYALTVLPSVQPEQRWIPVSESLPDGRLNKSYLVQDKDGRRAVGTYTNWGWMFGHYMNDPVAWMPLPKPYERKES